MATILATSRSFGSGDRSLVDELTAQGHTVHHLAPDHDREVLATVLPSVDAWIAGTAPITAELLDLAPNLRVIARYGVGYESVDVEAATARGIVVTNTPGANSGAVADHTVALLLAAMRSLVAGDRRLRAGDWSSIRGREIGSATVGIVGFGRIGQGVARRLSGFGPRVLAADPFVPAEVVAEAGAEPADLPAIARTCDVVSLHAPGGTTIVDEAWLAQLERPIVLVNAARADLVDEEALARALQDGRVRAYAADTLDGDVAGGSSPLLDPALADRVTLTPHLGAQTVESVDAMGTLAVDNALAVLEGTPPPHPVATPGAAAGTGAAAPPNPTVPDAAAGPTASKEQS